MKRLFSWEWQKLYMPPEMSRNKSTIVRVLNVKLTDPEKVGDVTRFRKEDTVFITGDGRNLSEDIKEFESWKIPHDLFAVNRSLSFHTRQVDHWAAVDIEECIWFTKNLSKNQEGYKPIIRHSIGGETQSDNFKGIGLFDIYWQMEYEWENEFQRRIFTGNTGYFAILASLVMGYKKVVLGGIPLSNDSHWYEPEDVPGPNWSATTYMQWMDFKMKHPKADQVKSLGGYSAFILGQATKEWVMNGIPDR